MRIQLLFFVLIFISFILNGQVSKQDIDIRNSFRKIEMNRIMKGFTTNSDQKYKSDISIDALYYEINLDLNFSSLQVNGEVTGRFRSKVSSLSQITLDLDDNMLIDAITGNSISYFHSGNKLRINLDQAYTMNDIFEVTVHYHGSPRGSGFGSWSMSSSRVATLSEPYGAKDWWPCKDTPSDKPDSVDINITVPTNFKAISNGTLIGVTSPSSSTSTWHWQERYPIATYLVSLAVAEDYAHLSDIYVNADNDTLPLEYWVYEDELFRAKDSFAEVPDYMKALEFYFGPYPFFKEKYGMAEFGWGGAMEHQTITSIGRVATFWRYIYVHELGHQWFGDQVTCADFHHIWLNEGFASYSEALFEEYTYGTAAYHRYMAIQDDSPWRGTIYIQDTTNTDNIFNKIVYDKGSWVVHMLRHVVGDSIFFKILKSYTTDPRFTYGSATTEGLKTICEEISGKDLGAFFEQWIYHPNHPNYRYDWNTVLSGNKWLTQLVIKQTQTHHIYTMPIDITFQASGWDSTFVVLNDTAYQRYNIVSSTQPTTVLFDKDKWILKRVSRLLDGVPDSDVIMPATHTLYQNYPNPFNPSTSIKFFTLDKAIVEIQIYDINGREIKNIIFNSPNKGSYSVDWDGSDNSGNQVSTGVYFCKMAVAGENIQSVRKMIKVN